MSQPARTSQELSQSRPHSHPPHNPLFRSPRGLGVLFWIALGCGVVVSGKSVWGGLQGFVGGCLLQQCPTSIPCKGRSNLVLW